MTLWSNSISASCDRRPCCRRVLIQYWLYYCNLHCPPTALLLACPFLNFEFNKINRLQLIQNSTAPQTVTSHQNVTLKSLHTFTHPGDKPLALAYNSLQHSKPSYLRELFTIELARSTWSPCPIHIPRLWKDLPSDFKFFKFLFVTLNHPPIHP